MPRLDGGSRSCPSFGWPVTVLTRRASRRSSTRTCRSVLPLIRTVSSCRVGRLRLHLRSTPGRLRPQPVSRALGRMVLASPASGRGKRRGRSPARLRRRVAVSARGRLRPVRLWVRLRRPLHLAAVVRRSLLLRVAPDVPPGKAVRRWARGLGVKIGIRILSLMSAGSISGPLMCRLRPLA